MKAKGGGGGRRKKKGKAASHDSDQETLTNFYGAGISTNSYRRSSRQRKSPDTFHKVANMERGLEESRKSYNDEQRRLQYRVMVEEEVEGAIGERGIRIGGGRGGSESDDNNAEEEKEEEERRRERGSSRNGYKKRRNVVSDDSDSDRSDGSYQRKRGGRSSEEEEDYETEESEEDEEDNFLGRIIGTSSGKRKKKRRKKDEGSPVEGVQHKKYKSAEPSGRGSVNNESVEQQPQVVSLIVSSDEDEETRKAEEKGIRNDIGGEEDRDTEDSSNQRIKKKKKLTAVRTKTALKLPMYNRNPYMRTYSSKKAYNVPEYFKGGVEKRVLVGWSKAVVDVDRPLETEDVREFKRKPVRKSYFPAKVVFKSSGVSLSQSSSVGFMGSVSLFDDKDKTNRGRGRDRKGKLKSADSEAKRNASQHQQEGSSWHSETDAGDDVVIMDSPRHNSQSQRTHSEGQKRSVNERGFDFDETREKGDGDDDETQMPLQLEASPKSFIPRTKDVDLRGGYIVDETSERIPPTYHGPIDTHVTRDSVPVYYTDSDFEDERRESSYMVDIEFGGGNSPMVRTASRIDSPIIGKYNFKKQKVFGGGRPVDRNNVENISGSDMNIFQNENDFELSPVVVKRKFKNAAELSTELEKDISLNDFSHSDLDDAEIVNNPTYGVQKADINTLPPAKSPTRTEKGNVRKESLSPSGSGPTGTGAAFEGSPDLVIFPVQRSVEKEQADIVLVDSPVPFPTSPVVKSGGGERNSCGARGHTPAKNNDMSSEYFLNSFSVTEIDETKNSISGLKSTKPKSSFFKFKSVNNSKSKSTARKERFIAKSLYGNCKSDIALEKRRSHGYGSASASGGERRRLSAPHGSNETWNDNNNESVSMEAAFRDDEFN
eukprot:Nk52_evm5s238 gene=Nk52_evmTU5s238